MNDWIRFGNQHPEEFEWVEVSSDDKAFFAFYTMDPYCGPTWNTEGDATEGGQAARPNDFWRSRQTSFEVA